MAGDLPAPIGTVAVFAVAAPVLEVGGCISDTATATTARTSAAPTTATAATAAG